MLARATHAKPLRLANNGVSRSYSLSERAPGARQRNIEALENMGKVLTRAVRSSDVNPGHNHFSRRRRQNNISSPPPDVRWKFPSIERKQFSLEPRLRDTSLDEAIQSSSRTGSLLPGCLVELRRHEIVRHAVVLGNVVVNHTPILICLLTTGEHLHVPETDVMFTIPQFVDADLTKRCGFAAETDPFKLAARQEVVKRAREFERAVEEAYNAISRQVNALYAEIQPQNADDWGEVSTIEAARILHTAPNPPIITLFAVHKHLMNQGDKYVAQSTAHRQINVFAIRPRAHVAQLQDVRKWIHEDHHVLDDFAKKARTLIDKARELAKQSEDEHTPVPIPSGVELNGSDREIIRLLQLSLDEFRSTQLSPYAALVPIIIKKIDRYKGNIGHWTILTALREIGAHEPWEDMASKNRDFMSVHGAAYLGAPTGEDKRKLAQTDAHESVRHDFGQLPVFVVDDQSAEELDDGLSIEPDPLDPSAQWLHVHIADPTAILTPNHPIAQRARKISATAYFIYDTWPMLPPSVSRTGLRQSEGNQEATAQNVLTFSIKLSSEGSILDYKVRPGVVRNVTIMRYDDVDAALGFTGFAPVKPFETSAKSTEPSDISYIQPHIDTLRRLWAASEKQVTARLQLPIFTYARPDAQVSMSPKPGLQTPISTFEPVFYRGFPQLTYSVFAVSFENGARSIVGECMKLACRVASRFCFEHKIPMFRRASSPMVFDDPAELERALSMRDSRGEINMQDFSTLNFRASPAEYTLERKAHWAMGIGAEEGYMRATSPLRRFQDLVAHWQIKSALLPNRSKKPRPPFSASDVMQIAAEQTKFEGIAKRVDRRHRRFWAYYYIYRYMQQTKTSDMPDPHPLRGITAHCVALPVKESRTMTYHTELFMPSLGLSGDLISQAKVGHKLGDQLLVNVKGVEMGIFPSLIVEPAV